MNAVVFVTCCIVLSVELPSKEVQCELDEIQRRLSEFLAAEENAMQERIRYNSSCEILLSETAVTDFVCADRQLWHSVTNSGISFSALTLLVGRQEEHPAHKKN